MFWKRAVLSAMLGGVLFALAAQAVPVRAQTTPILPAGATAACVANPLVCAGLLALAAGGGYLFVTETDLLDFLNLDGVSTWLSGGSLGRQQLGEQVLAGQAQWTSQMVVELAAFLNLDAPWELDTADGFTGLVARDTYVGAEAVMSSDITVWSSIPAEATCLDADLKALFIGASWSTNSTRVRVDAYDNVPALIDSEESLRGANTSQDSLVYNAPNDCDLYGDAVSWVVTVWRNIGSPPVPPDTWGAGIAYVYTDTLWACQDPESACYPATGHAYGTTNAIDFDVSVYPQGVAGTRVRVPADTRDLAGALPGTVITDVNSQTGTLVIPNETESGEQSAGFLGDIWGWLSGTGSSLLNAIRAAVEAMATGITALYDLIVALPAALFAYVFGAFELEGFLTGAFADIEGNVTGTAPGCFVADIADVGVLVEGDEGPVTIDFVYDEQIVYQPTSQLTGTVRTGLTVLFGLVLVAWGYGVYRRFFAPPAEGTQLRLDL